MISSPLFWVAAIGCLVVAGILMWGIGSFGAGGDPKQANRIMRYRIIAQFFAVIVIVALAWAMRNSGN